MKILIVLSLVFIFGLICWGCIKNKPQDKSHHSQSTWDKYDSLAELLQYIKNEKIESISFCDEDPEADVESWYVLEEYPKDQLEDAVKFLKEEFENDANGSPQGYYGNMTCQESLKIVTDKGKYVAPFVKRSVHGDWKERVSLVGLWPHLQKEKIQSISFCNDDPEVDIDSWVCRNIPKEKLGECIKIIGNAMQNADPKNFMEGPVFQGRMKIITDKGKYLVRAEMDATSNKIFGNEWSSSELGEFVRKYGLP